MECFQCAYTITDNNHPIMQGMSDFKINDEAFFLITKPTLSPQGLHVLATAPMPKRASAGDHGGSRAADLDLRTSLRPGSVIPSIRLDAGTQLRQLLGSAGSADDSARHCVGRQMADRSLDDRQTAAAGRPRTARRGVG